MMSVTRPKHRHSLLLPVLAVFVGLSSLPSSAGEVLRLCTGEQAELPLNNPDPANPGHAQILLTMVAENTRIIVKPIVTLWKSCQKLLSTGDVDGVVSMGYAAINIAIGVFPMNGEAPDPSRALGATTTLLYRRVGSNVDFNGVRFFNLRTAVGVTTSHQMNAISVARFGATVDDNSRTAASLVRRLASGRLDLIANDCAVEALIVNEAPGKIERLPQPLMTSNYYLAFSKKYYANNTATAQKLWAEIARVRSSAEYQNRINSAAERPLTVAKE